MSKDTNFIGQPVYVQLLNLVDRKKIKKISSCGGYDRNVKKLDGYTHFVAFLFAVLMRFDTLRETVIGMMAEANKLQHLGVDYLVRRSTLSDANNKRSSQFFNTPVGPVSGRHISKRVLRIRNCGQDRLHHDK